MAEFSESGAGCKHGDRTFEPQDRGGGVAFAYWCHDARMEKETVECHGILGNGWNNKKD
jgi:hypothetical protein